MNTLARALATGTFAGMFIGCLATLGGLSLAGVSVASFSGITAATTNEPIKDSPERKAEEACRGDMSFVADSLRYRDDDLAAIPLSKQIGELKKQMAKQTTAREANEVQHLIDLETYLYKVPRIRGAESRAKQMKSIKSFIYSRCMKLRE